MHNGFRQVSEEVNTRFEEVNTRFEDVNSRIDSLREEVNSRIDCLREDFAGHIRRRSVVLPLPASLESTTFVRWPAKSTFRVSEHNLKIHAFDMFTDTDFGLEDSSPLPAVEG